MSEALVPVSSIPSPPIPWRDPHSVSPGDLSSYIAALERACLDQPVSAELHTMLGVAYAVNYDVHKSMDALEAATSIDPANFWAQLKYAELHYRLRALARAEKETARALALATNAWQLSLARKQMQEIRRLSRDSTRNVTWDKPLTGPVLALSALMLVVFAIMMWT